MNIWRYIKIGEIVLALILLTLVLTKLLDIFIALIIMIAIQFIIGNVIYPLVIKKHGDKFTNIIESYKTLFDEDIHSKQELVSESRTIYSWLYTVLFYGIAIALSAIFVLYGTMYLLGRLEHFDSWYLIIGMYVLAPLYLFGMNKLLSFKSRFTHNELTGYTKSSLEYNIAFKRGSIDLSKVTAISFIENKLIDHMKYITVIEFVLNDNSKVYYNLQFYSKKNRNRIIDTLKESLSSSQN